MTQSINDQIDEFLLGRMTPEEEQAFLSALSSNPAMAMETEERRLLLTGIEAYGERELRTLLKNIHRKVKDKKSRKRKGPGRNTFILVSLTAAAALLLLGLVWWVFFPSSTGQRIYSQYFKPYPLSLNARDLSPVRALEEALDYYRLGRYAKAARRFEALPPELASRPQLTLAMGICLMEANRMEDAEYQFQAILASDNIFYHDEARWFLGLNFLRHNRIKEARQMFRILADDPTADHREEAMQIIRILEIE